jgi:hypothetical protein
MKICESTSDRQKPTTDSLQICPERGQDQKTGKSFQDKPRLYNKFIEINVLDGTPLRPKPRSPLESVLPKANAKANKSFVISKYF